jgi:hypothetical protein
LSHLTFPKLSSGEGGGQGVGAGCKASLRAYLSQVTLSNSPVHKRFYTAVQLEKLEQPGWVSEAEAVGLACSLREAPNGLIPGWLTQQKKIYKMRQLKIFFLH